jgi:hypothetical protein
MLQGGVRSGGSQCGFLCPFCVVGLIFRFGYPIYQIFDDFFHVVYLGPLVFIGGVLFHYIPLQSVNVLFHLYYSGGQLFGVVILF